MTARTPLLIASLALTGCFAPEAGVEVETEGMASSSGSDGSGSEAGEGPMTNVSSTTTDGPSTTTDDPMTGEEPTTTDGPTSTGGLTTTDNPTTGDDPFCGDGNVDPGEECDNAADNGPDATCLADCVFNVCGDGNLGPEEFCDDGEDGNLLEVGACAPDCSTVVEEKVIRLSSNFAGGNFQPNPVGFADSRCPAGTRALFSVPGVRQATDGTPNTADDPIDWPLHPYTGYVRPDGTTIWTTDETPLLGVRSGVAEELINPIYPPCEGPPEECFQVLWPAVTGMEQDWTPSLSDTCNGWTTNSSEQEFRVGEKTSTSTYLEASTRACSLATGDLILIGSQPLFYCVEQ